MSARPLLLVLPTLTLARTAHTGFGDPADDLNVATIIFLISGRLVLLRPRRAAHEEVKYDLQILADRVEFYWTHLSGIGTLENSLWAWDGGRIRVWLDALTIEKVRVDARRDAYETVRESVAIPLDFYPLGQCSLPRSSPLQLTDTVVLQRCSWTKGSLSGSTKRRRFAERSTLPSFASSQRRVSAILLLVPR